jgi:hypothetical protein
MWVIYKFEDGKQVSLSCPRLSDDEKYHNDKMDEVISYANETGLDVLVSFELRAEE